jgi:hypothetical protein
MPLIHATETAIGRKTLLVGAVLSILQLAPGPVLAAEGKNKLVGEWEKVDARTKKVVDHYTFHEDGTFSNQDDGPRVSDDNRPRRPRVPAKLFDLKGNRLTLFADLDPGPVIKSRNRNLKTMRVIFDEGSVDWKDDRFFAFTVTRQGPNTREVFEFHRLGDKADGKSLVGVWKQFDKRLGDVALEAEFRQNGSYELRRDGRRLANAGSSYKYDKGILEIMGYDEYRKSSYLVAKGQVSWTDGAGERFSLKLIWERHPLLNIPAQEQARFERVGNVRPSGGPRGVAINSPGGKVGDLTGLWEFVDQRTRKQVRVIEFKKNGKVEESIGGLRVGHPTANVERRFVWDETRKVLALYAVANKTSKYEEEVGQIVKWVDGDFFTYRVARSRHLRVDQTLECHRLGDPPNATTGDLTAGIWKMEGDPARRAFPTLVFRKNGACEGMGGDAAYKCVSGILTVWDTTTDTLYLRAAVTWEKNDSIALTILDGVRVRDRLSGDDRVLKLHRAKENE